MAATTALAKLTKLQAKALTKQIRVATDHVWELLVEARDGRAWEAMGYDSFGDYVISECDMSRGHAYRLMDKGVVIRELTEAAGGDVEVSGRTATAVVGDLPALVESVRHAVAEAAPEDRPKVAKALAAAAALKVRVSRVRDKVAPIPAGRRVADDEGSKSESTSAGVIDAAAVEVPNEALDLGLPARPGTNGSRVAPDQAPGGNGATEPEQQGRSAGPDTPPAEPGGGGLRAPQEPPASLPMDVPVFASSSAKVTSQALHDLAVLKAEIFAAACKLSDEYDLIVLRDRLNEAIDLPAPAPKRRQRQAVDADVQPEATPDAKPAALGACKHPKAQRRQLAYGTFCGVEGCGKKVS